MDENFITYLKEKHPYLYDLEMAVRKVFAATGYGSVSVKVGIERKAVTRIELASSATKIYKLKDQNVL